MKVLLITGSFPPMRCGVGDYTHRLVLALACEPGLQVAVLTSRAAAPCELPKDFALFPIVETWDWHAIGPIFEVIRTWAPDLVHIQLPALGYGDKRLPWLLPLCLHLYGLPVVQTWHAIYRFKAIFRAKRILRFISKAVVPGGLVVMFDDYRKRTGAMMRLAFLNKELRFIPNASAIPTVKLSVVERDAIRAQYARPNAQMIVYFGFIYPSKRVELLFQIADPNSSHLVIIGDALREEDLWIFPKEYRVACATYHQSVKRLAETEVWKGKVTMAGFLPPHEAACVIAAAHAVVLPMLGGAGEWNTSLHGAQAEGTFVLTTSRQRRGYDPRENTYFTAEHDLEDMRTALKKYVGKRSAGCHDAAQAWRSIGKAHVELYRMRGSTRTKVNPRPT